MAACSRNDRDLPSWSCEFDSRHPLHIIAPSQVTFSVPKLFEHSADKNYQAGYAYSMIIDLRSTEVPCQAPLLAHESGSVEVPCSRRQISAAACRGAQCAAATGGPFNAPAAPDAFSGQPERWAYAVRRLSARHCSTSPPRSRRSARPPSPLQSPIRGPYPARSRLPTEAGICR
jgi:hypothetical protein